MLGQGALGELALGQPYITVVIIATTVRKVSPSLQAVRVTSYTLQQVRVDDSVLEQIRAASPALYE